MPDHSSGLFASVFLEEVVCSTSPSGWLLELRRDARWNIVTPQLIRVPKVAHNLRLAPSNRLSDILS